jgi:hypothetical protein
MDVVEIDCTTGEVVVRDQTDEDEARLATMRHDKHPIMVAPDTEALDAAREHIKSLAATDPAFASIAKLLNL